MSETTKVNCTKQLLARSQHVQSLAILIVYQDLTRPSNPWWALLSNTINPIVLPVTQMPFSSRSPLLLILNLVLLLFNPSLFLLTDDNFLREELVSSFFIKVYDIGT